MGGRGQASMVLETQHAGTYASVKVDVISMAAVQVAMNVGVYYCANAVGRLVGTLASGALYSYVGSTVVDGFGACLLVSVSFCVLSTLIDTKLWEDPDREGAWVPKWLRARQAALPPGEAAAADALEQAAEEQLGAPADSLLELAEKTSSTEKEGCLVDKDGQGGRSMANRAVQ